MAFDPYLQWLKLPGERRPENYYELLGLPDFEPDVERIRDEAMRRIAHVRKYQLGEHSEAAIRVLGELAAAFDTLTRPDRKQLYDAQLRGPPAVAPTSESGPPANAALQFEISPPAVVARPRRPASKTSRLPWAMGGVLVAGIVAALVYAGRTPTSEPQPKAAPARTSAARSPQPTPSPASPPPASVPPAEVWRPLFASAVEITPRKGLKLNGNVLELDSTGMDEPDIVAENCILRAKVRKLPGQNISLRLRKSTGGYYAAWFNGGRWFGVGKGNWQGFKDLKQAHTPKSYDRWFEFKFAAVGDRLTIWADGEQVLSVRDSSYTSGSPSISATRGRGLFKEIEIQLLPD